MLLVGLYARMTSAIELLLSKALLFYTLSEIFSPSKSVMMNSSSFLFANSIYAANFVVSCLLIYFGTPCSAYC